MNNNETELEITQDDLKPELWVRLLDEITDSIEYGKKYPIKYLEDKLLCKADTIKFGVNISQINDNLIQFGYYLSARDQNKEAYIVLMEDASEIVARSRVRRSFREMVRAMTLFGGIARNPKAQITEETKRRLLSNEEKAAARLSLMRHPSMAAQLKPKERKKMTHWFNDP